MHRFVLLPLIYKIAEICLSMYHGIDIHCHVILMEQSEDIVKESIHKLKGLINIATDMEEAKKSLELSRKYPGFVFSSAAIHPEGAASAKREETDEMLQFIKDNRKNLVSIGEVGVDYFHVKDAEKQKRAEESFVQFIELANQLKKPLQIHARNSEEKKTAFSDALKILADNNARSVVMHSFSGSDAELAHALEQGYYISVSTIIGRSSKHKRFAGKIPLDKLLLETDAPWLHPYQREENNYPWNIAESAKIIGEIKEMKPEEILRTTEANAAKVFGLGL